MAEKRILIVHPYDKTTSFLDRIKNHLQTIFENDVHYFSVKPNDESHNQCLERISTHLSSGLIIFLGHGRSDKLYGSKADEYSAFVSADAVAEFPEKYYYNDNFINEANVEIFSGKKVFCLACNSNDKIANYALDKEVKSFLGFGDIPTSPEELIDDGIENVSKNIVKSMKTELIYIIKRSLVNGIAKNFTFEQLQNLIDFIINQRISDILINQKEFKDRYTLTDYLYFLKKDIKIKGNKKLKLIE